MRVGDCDAVELEVPAGVTVRVAVVARGGRIQRNGNGTTSVCAVEFDAAGVDIEMRIDDREEKARGASDFSAPR